MQKHIGNQRPWMTHQFNQIGRNLKIGQQDIESIQSEQRKNYPQQKEQTKYCYVYIYQLLFHCLQRLCFQYNKTKNPNNIPPK